MRAFHAAKTGFERDEIAVRQLRALRKHLPPGDKRRRISSEGEASIDGRLI
jgi:hypothetical protein